MDGGGPLALTIDSVKKFCLKLFTHILHSSPSLTLIKIYWVSPELLIFLFLSMEGRNWIS
jgi:hypothetical protein